MASVSDDEVGSWVSAIAQLHEAVVTHPGDARAAREAIANLWSGFGYQDAPMEVLEMLVQALETGYASALRDVRDGRFDQEIAMWRPAS